VKSVVIYVLKFMGLFNAVQYFKFKFEITNCARKGKRRCESIMDLHQPYNKKLLFIHIPKAAGMSIVKKLYGKTESHHAFAQDYINEDSGKFNSSFSFSITRDPYVRLSSAYLYLKSGGMNVIDQVWWDLYLKPYANFEDFILNGGLKKAVESNAEHFIPQYKFVCDINNNVICDYIGKLENIGGVERKLSEIVDRDILFSKENRNKGRGGEYTEEMRCVVSSVYSLDFELFGYEK